MSASASLKGTSPVTNKFDGFFQHQKPAAERPSPVAKKRRKPQPVGADRNPYGRPDMAYARKIQREKAERLEQAAIRGTRMSQWRRPKEPVVWRGMLGRWAGGYITPRASGVTRWLAVLRRLAERPREWWAWRDIVPDKLKRDPASQAVSYWLMKSARRGWVERKDAPLGHRRYLWRLTAEGREVVRICG